ncbi:hypothetical protein [Cyanobacterium aponinum]|uniref:Uncharacterized protein n=1 Tax=Cyanobacterium aponinum 0216 TaxID=2676140 RepID=A0A844GT80_9CHRO|nr:hypothetical protein [Cyanobacterium aponinum]MTF37998.1 hypothetical protein [Cyanobacterium aponinum 0216]
MKKTLLALGVAGLGSLLAAPAFAQTYASGSVTAVLMNGASMSVGAEIGAPKTSAFPGPVTVTPGHTGDLDANTYLVNNLEVDPGALAPDPGLAAGNTSFTAAAAAVLTGATGLDAQVSIIRAGAGADGLE